MLWIVCKTSHSHYVITVTVYISPAFLKKPADSHATNNPKKDFRMRVRKLKEAVIDF